MTSKRPSVSPATVIALLALFFALGGSAFAIGGGLSLQREGRTDSSGGISDESFEDALHEASQIAARFGRGRYKGRPFEVTRTTIVFRNPHITAYKVTITPSG